MVRHGDASAQQELRPPDGLRPGIGMFVLRIVLTNWFFVLLDISLSVKWFVLCTVTRTGRERLVPILLAALKTKFF